MCLKNLLSIVLLVVIGLQLMDCRSMKKGKIVTFQSNKTVQVNGTTFSQINCDAISGGLCANITEIACLEQHGKIMPNSCSVSASKSSPFHNVSIVNETVICDGKQSKASCYIRIRPNLDPFDDPFDDQDARKMTTMGIVVFIVFLIGAVVLLFFLIYSICYCIFDSGWRRTLDDLTSHTGRSVTSSAQGAAITVPTFEINRTETNYQTHNATSHNYSSYSSSAATYSNDHNFNDPPPTYSQVSSNNQQFGYVNKAFVPITTSSGASQSFTVGKLYSTAPNKPTAPEL